MPLFIDRQDIHRLAQACHLLFMVGSYDGNPNMGDVLQLAGAVGALAALTKFVTPVILIEAERYDSHRAICGCHPDVFADAVILAYSDKKSTPLGELEILPHLAAAVPVAMYLYGGGYANRWWSQRKAELADAVSDWLAETGRASEAMPVLATGIQADESLLDGDQALLRWLRRAVLLRMRDPLSVEKLAAALPQAVVGVDDALHLILSRFAMSPRAAFEKGSFRLGAHLNANYYSAQDADRLAERIAELAQEISTHRAAAVTVVPILAYEGGEIRESERIVHLSARFAEKGIGLGQCIDLSRGDRLEDLASVHALVSCSYHVAMAACAAGIPTVLAAENAYYSQKVLGLHQWFGRDLLRVMTPAEDPAATGLASFLTAGEAYDRGERNWRLTVRSETDMAAARDTILALTLRSLTHEVASLAAVSVSARAEASRLRSLCGTFLNSRPHIAQPRTESAEGVLRNELSKAYRRPWRPLKYALSYSLLIWLSKLTPPLPRRMTDRFSRSAAKRSPHRFDV